MRRLTDFWKMRRQSGSVKTAVLLFLFALYFIAQSVTAAINYARFANQKIEYVVTVNNPDGVQSSDITKLSSLAGVVCVSPQKSYLIQYRSKAGMKDLALTEVCAGYLKSAYGICSDIFGKRFYLNKCAWKEIPSGGDVRFVRADGLPEESPVAYSAGNSISLADCTSLRVMAGKTDVTGKTLENIKKLGYSVDNEQEILRGSYELVTVMLKLKYGIIIAVLAGALGYKLI